MGPKKLRKNVRKIESPQIQLQSLSWVDTAADMQRRGERTEGDGEAEKQQREDREREEAWSPPQSTEEAGAEKTPRIEGKKSEMNTDC